MEKMYQRLVLEFDTATGKCSVNGGVMVLFKGFITEARFNEIVANQKKIDEENPPPSNPTDRDGAWVCKVAAGTSVKTWHFCTTVPPYACSNSGSTCS
jgi:hypothetical protein